MTTKQLIESCPLLHTTTCNIAEQNWIKSANDFLQNYRTEDDIKILKMQAADLRFQRDALLEMTWLDLPAEPSESTHLWRKLFAEGWERKS